VPLIQKQPAAAESRQTRLPLPGTRYSSLRWRIRYSWYCWRTMYYSYFW
jgi:hypothetical protein